MKISNDDKKYLLSLTPEDLDFSTLVHIFGSTININDNISKASTPNFRTTDEMTLSPSEYFVKEVTNTTVGRFIWNKYLIERVGLQDVTGYINFVIDDKANGKIEAIITKGLIDDKVTVEQFHKYVDYRDTLGMQLNSVITTSFTPLTIKTPPEIQKRKAELFKQYKKELDDGDIIVSERIEKELTSRTKEIFKGDPGMDLYNSGARGNFGNYKNMNLFKGVTANNVTGKFDIVRSSFMDGISKQDIPSFATAVVSGAFPKAVKVQEFS